jgi:hypothetical protein
MPAPEVAGALGGDPQGALGAVAEEDLEAGVVRGVFAIAGSRAAGDVVGGTEAAAGPGWGDAEGQAGDGSEGDDRAGCVVVDDRLRRRRSAVTEGGDGQGGGDEQGHGVR